MTQTYHRAGDGISGERIGPGMGLYERLEDDLRQARRDRDQVALDTLGYLKSEVVNATKEPGAGEIDDPLVTRVARREVKKREEAADLYRKGGRAETAERELAEAELIRRYLPEPVSDAELEAGLKEVVAQTGAAGPKDLGRVMKEATARFGDRAEGGRIASVARRLLG